MPTIFDEDTRELIYEKSRRLSGSTRRDFVAECERELWDFMPFDLGEIRATINRVFNRYS